MQSVAAPSRAAAADKAAAVRGKIDDAIDRLGAALAAGKSDALREFLAVAARFHRYSLGNQILIALQCPHATRVAGFRAWNRFNRYVRKGEKGIQILAPMVFGGGKAGEVDGDGEGEPDARATERPRRQRGGGVRFRVVYVFDVSQTDGEPLPELHHEYRGEPVAELDALRAFVRGRGWTLAESDDLGGADGVCNGRERSIAILRGMGTAREFATLAHETAHSILHFGEGAERATRQVRELEAEAAAFIVCSAVGVECTAASSDYVQLYGGDAAALKDRLGRIQAAASAILAGILGNPGDSGGE